MRNLLPTAVSLAVLGAPALASANPDQLFTASESGSYHNRFCPPIAEYLGDQWFGHACTPTAGTSANFDAVIANPGAAALGQLDVVAMRDQQTPGQVVIAKRTGVDECLFAVTNRAGATWRDIVGAAGRVPFALPPRASGSSATFDFIMGLDGAAPSRLTYTNSAADAVRSVASGAAAVAFFVQFADLDTEAFQVVADNELTVVGVGSRAMLRAEIGGESVYSVTEVEVSEGGWLSSAESIQTSCTEVVIFTGNPESVGDEGELSGVIEALGQFDLTEYAGDNAGWFADLLDSAQRLSASAAERAVDEWETSGASDMFN